MLVIYETESGSIRQISQNTPMGEVPSAMIPSGCNAIKTDQTDFSGHTHRVSADGQIIKRSAEDVEAQEIASAWLALRARRLQLIAASDWSQLPDTGRNKQIWAEYRQALRDIPQNTTDPREVVWPTPPQ